MWNSRLPNVGKSIFIYLKLPKMVKANFLCTIDPNIGIVDVVDKRLDKLTQLSIPKKIYTNITFVILQVTKEQMNGEGL